MTAAPTPPSLEYAPTHVVRPRPKWLSLAALGCGIIPAIVGVAIAGAYELTELQQFRLLGFIWLLLGGLIVLAGFGFALTHFCWPRGSNQRPGNLRAIIAVIVLLLNFPVALGCMVVGAWSADRVTCIVHNDGAKLIDSVLITHGTRNVRIGPIPSHESRSGVLVPNYGDVTTVIRENGIDGNVQTVGHGDAGEIGSPMDLHVDNDGKATLFMR